MPARKLAIIEAPSNLGLTTSGVEELPTALLNAGLAAKLAARLVGRLKPPAHESTKDSGTGVLNASPIADYAMTLAGAIEAVIDDGDVPLVLGGDCSILLGCLLAMRRRGRSGLFFIDAHADFFQPEAEPLGEVASMELALATGNGPSVLVDLEGRGPLVREEDVAAFGRRDEEDSEQSGSQRIEDTKVKLISLTDIRRDGAQPLLEDALRHLDARHLDGFWLHLDADVLDDAINPAVDHRIEGGLSWDELTAALKAAFATGHVKGMDITILNPRLDKDGTIVRRFVDAVAEGLGAGAR
ncbi:MAG TPA: arginase family protein [Rhizobiaceae bacterium]|nr:arginase family protein [Rhizobiaceae bacterium]